VEDFSGINGGRKIISGYTGGMHPGNQLIGKCGSGLTGHAEVIS